MVIRECSLHRKGLDDKVMLRVNEYVSQYKKNLGAEVDEAIKAVIIPANFYQELSVFRDFQDDTDKHLRNMLEQDFTYSKIERICGPRVLPKDQLEDRIALIKETLQMHYSKLKNIFLYYAAISSREGGNPKMGINEITEMVRRSGLLGNMGSGNPISLARLDQTLIATNTSSNGFKQSHARELERYEFLEFIIRLAMAKQESQKESSSKSQTLAEITDAVIRDHILPHNLAAEGLQFRVQHMYNLKVDMIFSKNQSVLRTIFKSFTNPKKDHLEFAEVRQILDRAGLVIPIKSLKLCYNESLMSRIDTMSEQETNTWMSYVEFLVFLARIADEIYDIHSDLLYEPLHLKIDRLLQEIFSAYGYTKLFSFDDEMPQSSEYDNMYNKSMNNPFDVAVDSDKFKNPDMLKSGPITFNDVTPRKDLDYHNGFDDSEAVN